MDTVPEIMPDKVNCVPATLRLLLAAAKDTAPLKLEVPVLVAIVPPLSVIASAPTVTFCKSKVPPLATVTPPAVVPKPVALVTASVPALTVIAPVLVLAPDTVMMPKPAFVKPIAEASVIAALTNKSLVATPSATVKTVVLMVPCERKLILPAMTASALGSVTLTVTPPHSQ